MDPLSKALFDTLCRGELISHHIKGEIDETYFHELEAMGYVEIIRVENGYFVVRTPFGDQFEYGEFEDADVLPEEYRFIIRAAMSIGAREMFGPIETPK